MNTARAGHFWPAWYTVLVLSLNGCQTRHHDVTAARPGEVTVCARCYDEIVKARGKGGPLAGLRTNRMIAKHVCEDCNTEMSLYTAQGVLMVKCARCTPEGVACDKCVPPVDYTK